MENRVEYIKDRVMPGVVCESVGEYLLPDYNGDVKKILHVGVRVMPSGKFISGDTAEFTGTVGYEVVYIDGDSCISHFAFSTDYEFAVKCSDEKFVNSDIDVTLDNYNLRPIGPRKISAKAQLSGTVHLIEREEVVIDGDGFTDGEPEVLTKDALVRAAYFDKGRETEICEELVHLDGVIADEVEILYTGYEVRVDERDAGRDGARHKGEIKVACLLKCGDSVPEMMEKAFVIEDSFFTSDELPKEALNDARVISSSICVKSVASSVSATADGASVTVSLVTEGKMRISANTAVMLAKDAFLTECGTENEVSEFAYSELLGGATRISSVTGESDASSSGYEGGSFIFVSPKARVNSVEIIDNTVKLSGDIRFSAIACEVSEGDIPVFSSVKADVPFEEKVNVGCQIPKGAKAEFEISVREGEIELVGDKLRMSAKLDLSVCASKDRRESYVSASYKTDTVFEKDPSLVTVYYPDPGETLFEVSKKFHRSPLSVASVNSLTESVFADKTAPLNSLGVKKLTIR